MSLIENRLKYIDITLILATLATTMTRASIRMLLNIGNPVLVICLLCLCAMTNLCSFTFMSACACVLELPLLLHECHWFQAGKHI